MRTVRLVFVCLILLVAFGAIAQSPAMKAATSLMKEEKWEEAAAAFEKIVRAEPKNAVAWMQLGNIYDRLGKYDKELDAAQKAIDAGFQAPGLAMAAMVRAYLGLGDTEAAMKKVEEMAAGGPNRALLGRLGATAGTDRLKADPRWKEAMKKLTPCTSPEYRQFDFWLGDFKVEDPNGNYVGDNEITLHLDGCMLMESWKGASGMHGMSTNFYDPSDQTWNQNFIDNNGAPANWPPLKGKLENGSMVLWSPEGESRTRWTWTKVSDDKVRQMAESTSDGGKTWTVVWDSYYIRKK